MYMRERAVFLNGRVLEKQRRLLAQCQHASPTTRLLCAGLERRGALVAMKTGGSAGIATRWLRDWRRSLRGCQLRSGVQGSSTTNTRVRLAVPELVAGSLFPDAAGESLRRRGREGDADSINAAERQSQAGGAKGGFVRPMRTSASLSNAAPAPRDRVIPEKRMVIGSWRMEVRLQMSTQRAKMADRVVVAEVGVVVGVGYSRWQR